MLDAGVDGIDLRIENHSTHTDYPEDYGFNDAVLRESSRLGQTGSAALARIRGDAYTDSLRQAKRLIGARRLISIDIPGEFDYRMP